MQSYSIVLAIGLLSLLSTPEGLAAVPPIPSYPQPGAVDVPLAFKATWHWARGTSLGHARLRQVRDGRVVQERYDAATPELSIGRGTPLTPCTDFVLELINKSAGHETTQVAFRTGGCPQSPPPAPCITAPPASVRVPAGTTTTFTVETGCGSVSGITWFAPNGTVFGHDTALTFPSPMPVDAGIHLVRVEGPGGVVEAIFELAVDPPTDDLPCITTPPASVRVPSGTTTTFTVETGCGPVSGITWFAPNGTVFGHDSSLTFPSPMPDDAGIHLVRVEGPGGVVEATFELAVDPVRPAAPCFATLPEGVRTQEGNSVLLFVDIGCGPAQKVHWFDNQDRLIGTGEALALERITLAMGGRWRVRLEGDGGAAEVGFDLEVLAAPADPIEVVGLSSERSVQVVLSTARRGEVQLQIAGVPARSTVELLTSTDLAVWSPISRLAGNSTGGVIQFTGQFPAGEPVRFFRARLVE